MTTILNEIHLSGNTLMKNYQCDVVIKPSRSNKIQIFTDNSDSGFEAGINNVFSTDHCVTLCSKEHRTLLGDYKYKAILCEHFMAACAFCGITAIDVHLSKPEMPVFDGSAKTWVDAFKKAGITAKKDKILYTVSEPVYYLNGKTCLAVLPDKELNITYAVNYDHKNLHNRWVSFDYKKPDEIIEARTFGFYKDLKKFQLLGFAKGVSMENTIGLVEDGFMTELRSEDEPVKHKILDLFGDFYLTGVSLLDMCVHVIAKEAGHAVHIKTAKMLKDKLVRI